MRSERINRELTQTPILVAVSKHTHDTCHAHGFAWACEAPAYPRQIFTSAWINVAHGLLGVNVQEASLRLSMTCLTCPRKAVGMAPIDRKNGAGSFSRRRALGRAFPRRAWERVRRSGFLRPMYSELSSFPRSAWERTSGRSASIESSPSVRYYPRRQPDPPARSSNVTPICVSRWRI